MAPTQSLRVLRHQLHLSYSQINTYLTCSLRYFFQYMKGSAPEHIIKKLHDQIGACDSCGTGNNQSRISLGR